MCTVSEHIAMFERASSVGAGSDDFGSRKRPTGSPHTADDALLEIRPSEEKRLRNIEKRISDFGKDSQDWKQRCGIKPQNQISPLKKTPERKENCHNTSNKMALNESVEPLHG